MLVYRRIEVFAIMLDEFKFLEEVLQETTSKKPLYYIPNPGNWGDGLIRYGTLKFLNSINVDYRELRIKRKHAWCTHLLKKGCMIYGGGGGWSRLWDHALGYVTRFNKRHQVIVLPSTYECSYQISNTTFFCRDIFESQQNMPNAIFCHDLAFYIGRRPFHKGKGIGFFFRTDKESAGIIKIPPNNSDLSLKGNHLSDIEPFFEDINKYAVIHTDRLHVAIAACLLNKEVHIYPGSYFKNKAVYLSSMKGYFDKVYFHHENFDFLKL